LYSLQKEPTASSGLTRRLRGGGTLRVVSDPGEMVNSDSPDLSSNCDEKKTSELSQSPTERSVSFAPIVGAAAASNGDAAAASVGGAAAASNGGAAAAASNGGAAAASDGGAAAVSEGGVAAASNGDAAAAVADGGESAHGDSVRS
jgi:hypothetical protein